MHHIWRTDCHEDQWSRMMQEEKTITKQTSLIYQQVTQIITNIDIN